MGDADHFVEVCPACYGVVTQCRCPSPTKSRRVSVRPCAACLGQQPQPAPPPGEGARGELISEFPDHELQIWQYHHEDLLTASLAAHVRRLRAELDEARADAERERMRLAGCSVAALGYYKRGDAIAPEYGSGSLDDVIALRDRAEAAEADAARLREALGEHLEAERLWVTNASEAFERAAADFRRDTGYLAPGKDVPAGLNPSDEYERERREAWRVWNERKRDERHARWAALAADGAGKGKS